MKAWHIMLMYLLSLVASFLILYYLLRLSGVGFAVSPFSDIVPFDNERVAAGPIYATAAAVNAYAMPAVLAGLVMRRVCDRLPRRRVLFVVGAALPTVAALTWSLIVHGGVAWEYQCLWRVALGLELTAALEPCKELALAGLHGVMSICVGSLLAASILMRSIQGRGVLEDSASPRK